MNSLALLFTRFVIITHMQHIIRLCTTHFPFFTVCQQSAVCFGGFQTFTVRGACRHMRTPGKLFPLTPPFERIIVLLKGNSASYVVNPVGHLCTGHWEFEKVDE